MTGTLRRQAVIGLAAASLALGARAQGVAPLDEKSKIEQETAPLERLARLQLAKLELLRRDQRHLETKIEEMKRFLPPSFDPAEDQRRFGAWAKRAGLATVDVGTDRRDVPDRQRTGEGPPPMRPCAPIALLALLPVSGAASGAERDWLPPPGQEVIVIQLFVR